MSFKQIITTADSILKSKFQGTINLKLSKTTFRCSYGKLDVDYHTIHA